VRALVVLMSSLMVKDRQYHHRVLEDETTACMYC
jgi:hypothetical protein